MEPCKVEGPLQGVAQRCDCFFLARNCEVVEVKRGSFDETPHQETPGSCQSESPGLGKLAHDSR
jgi:hypothetical protein